MGSYCGKIYAPAIDLPKVPIISLKILLGIVLSSPPMLDSQVGHIVEKSCLIYKTLVCVCLSVCVSIHADFSAMLRQFGEFEVSLEPAQQGHALI